MLNGNLNIRRATIEDLEIIISIDNESFSSPWSRQSFIDELTSNLLAYYSIVELDDEIIGYMGMWIILDEAHLTNVAIRSKARGLKLGELAMRHMMGIAKLHGANKMTLEVRKSNQVAINLYNKLNFETLGYRVDYYSNPLEDALIMWVKL